MKKKSSQSSPNKNIASLKATAAAVIALNSGTISAISCPSFISVSIPGVCTFDAGSSVTVANGGTVYGISMNNYQPAPSSFITVDTGGVIAGPNAGISVTGTSSLSGSISNKGTITATTTGIGISDNSTVGGGISNSGIINVTAADGQGISVYSNSSITGGISNSGTINATNGTQEGQTIAVYTSAITGGISNSGVLNGFTGIRIDEGSSIIGDISNSGSISAQYVGIVAYHGSTISGDIVNNGNISGPSGVVSQYGIAVQSSSQVQGNISNSGSIHATIIGIGIYNASLITGNISNSGIINACNGIGLSSGAHVDGNISNSGTIGTNGGELGIFVSSSSLTGQISNSGSISAITGIGITNSQIGGISNSGTISSVTGTGINVSQTTTINGGISNSGTIQGGTYAISVTADSTVDNLDIIGQTARIIGEVLATGTSVNITSGAVFTSEGTFDVQNFNIATNALFHMANAITASGAVNNSGTLSVATGTLQTITGNYTQDAHGVYQIGATNGENYGQLSASGIANLSASGDIDVLVQPGASFHQGEVLSNVLSGGTFTAPINGYTVTDNSFLWQFTAITNGHNGVDLSIGINPNAGSACQGTYCAHAASVIIGQLAAGNTNFSTYGSVPTAAAFNVAASQATPELINENLQVTQLVSRTVIDVLPMWSALRGASTGDAMLYQPGKVWLKPYGASMTQNQRNTVNGYTASVYGLVAGGDVQITNHWMLGGALAAGGDNLRGKSVLSGQSIDSAQYQALIYTSKLLTNNAYLAAQGLLGYGDNDSKRSIPLFASTTKGRYNSWFTDLSAELGWSRAITDRLVFTPAVNASYLYINQGHYTETGSLMNLNVRENNNSSLVVGADANIAYRATTLKNQQDITLTGHAGVAYDVIHNQPSTISSFVAGGPNFSTYGIQYNGAVFRGGLGATLANPTRPLSVNLNADLQAGNNGYSGIYSATLKYKI